MPRIASLLPSLTEVVCALGRRDDLVARSHECDFPTSVEALPALTAPKFDPVGSSGAIDSRVKALIRDGLSVYRVDAAGLRAVRPDVVLTQDQCEVCAAGLADIEAALETWLGRRPDVLSLAPRTLFDVIGDVERIGSAIGADEEARALTGRLRSRVEELTERGRNLSPGPRVATIEWLDPLMAAGNWVPELVERAGGVNLFGVAGEHSPWFEWDALCAEDPDVLVVIPCGFDRARTLREISLLESRPGYRALRAVRDGRVAVADGNQYFNRSGPRLVESLEILLEIFQPEANAFGHRGRGWDWH